MRTLAIIVTGLIFGAVFLFIKNQSPKGYGKIPGSYKGLELFSYIRAYPNKDIPADGWSRGFDHHKKYIDTYGSVKNNQHWKAAGPMNTAGRTLTIAVNPQNDSVIYAGSASGGLWRSRRLGLGNSWERVNTGYPVLGVSTIEFAPGDSSTLYIGTGEVYNYYITGNDAAFRSTRGSYGIGILKSSDGGKSWEKSLDWTYNQQHGVWMVKVSPSEPRIVYAATTDGVYKSTDAGLNWEKVLDQIMVTDIEVDPRDSDKAVASCGNFNTPGKGIYYTHDGGDSWFEATGEIPGDFNGKILLARAPSDPQIMYASIGNGFEFNDGYTWLLRSDDGGVSWREHNTLDYSKWQGWFSHDVAVSPDDPDKIMCVGIDIFKSLNAGIDLEQKSFGGVSLATPPVDGPDGPPRFSHSDHHFVMYHPNLDSVILFGNDGGVYLSFDDGESFRSANGGYQSTQFYNGFSVSHSNPEFALGGLQDNSTVIYRGGPAWQRAIGGDGSWSGINQQNDRIIYGSYQNLGILRSVNAGFGFAMLDIPLAVGEEPLFISPYIIAESNPDVIYACGIYVYKSTDGGDNWIVANDNNPLNIDPIFVMDVYSKDEDILYVATVGLSKDPSVFVSIDGAESFSEINSGLPNRIPNDVVIDPEDPATAYVAFGGFGTPHLYRTTDFGFSWEAIDNGLPDVPGNAVALDPTEPNVIYFGNDIGVYVSVNNGDDWMALSEGLPEAVIAMDLTVSPSDRQLWVATHGNGSYRADLIETMVSTEDPLSEIDLKIYPNPAEDHVMIETAEDFKGYQLYDNLGRKLQSGFEKRVDLTSIPAGYYFLELRLSSGATVKRLVVN